MNSQLKAIFLDLDETLCDTTGANNQALQVLAKEAERLFGPTLNSELFAQQYLKGIYRELSEAYQAKLFPVTHEESFRHSLLVGKKILFLISSITKYSKLSIGMIATFTRMDILSKKTSHTFQNWTICF